MEEQNDSLDCLIEYRTDLFLPETIGQMLREFSAVLDGVARSPTSPVSELPWMDADDRNQLMRRYGSELPREVENDLLTRWHFRAAEQPDTPCVHHDNSVLSYREIDHWAETIAKQLTDAGLEPGGVVAVYTEPTPLMVVSVLAILKVGCAFLPLLPDTPVDRRRQMLATAKCSTWRNPFGPPAVSSKSASETNIPVTVSGYARACWTGSGSGVSTTGLGAGGGDSSHPPSNAHITGIRCRVFMRADEPSRIRWRPPSGQPALFGTPSAADWRPLSTNTFRTARPPARRN